MKMNNKQKLLNIIESVDQEIVKGLQHVWTQIGHDYTRTSSENPNHKDIQSAVYDHAEIHLPHQTQGGF